MKQVITVYQSHHCILEHLFTLVMLYMHEDFLNLFAASIRQKDCELVFYLFHKSFVEIAWIVTL